jgi:hypothetical protein
MMHCIIVLYVYVFCYVWNKIIETISRFPWIEIECLNSEDQSTIIQLIAKQNKNKPQNRLQIYIYWWISMSLAWDRHTYLIELNQLMGWYGIPSLFFLANWISKINRYKQTNKKKPHRYIHWNFDLGLRET